MHKLNKNRIDIRVKILSVLTVMFIAVAYLFVFSPYTTTAGCSQPPPVPMIPQNFTQLAKNCGRQWSTSVPSKR